MLLLLLPLAAAQEPPEVIFQEVQELDFSDISILDPDGPGCSFCEPMYAPMYSLRENFDDEMSETLQWVAQPLGLARRRWGR